MKLKVINTTGTNTNITVSDELFAKKVNEQLLAQAVRVYLANLRKSTSKTQTRSDVTRTSKKWYRQKGTGNARHGAKTATLFVGGAVAHGPRGVENWKLKLTKTLKQAALKNALKAQEENILVNDEILETNGKTKKAYQIISKLADKKEKVLVVLLDNKVEVIRSLRNLENVLITKASRLNTLEVASADKIVFTKEAIKSLEKRLVRSEKSKTAQVVKKTPTRQIAKSVTKTEISKKPVVKKAASKTTVKKTTKIDKKVKK